MVGCCAGSEPLPSLNTGLETRSSIRRAGAVGEFGDDQPTAEVFASAVTPTINALQMNAALDREEIDILWWVLGGVSEIFGRPLQSLSPEVRAVTAGVEIGALMRALPTQSHRNLALRGLEETAPLSLSKLLASIGEDCVKIAASFEDETLINKAPLVFPLLSAIRSGESAGPGADSPRSLSEWGARALLERAVLRIQYKDRRTI